MDAKEPLSTEKDFYLAEFRARSLGIVMTDPVRDQLGLKRILDELSENQTRCVLISGHAEPLAPWTESLRSVGDSQIWPGEIWRALDSAGRVGVVLDQKGSLVGFDAGSYEGRCRELAVRLRLSKVVWLRSAGGIFDENGERVSLADCEDLRRMLSGSRSAGQVEPDLLHEFALMLEQGTSSINLCSADGLAEELFTYAGSGTLFTRERYAEVYRLGLDDYDAAAGLIARGTEEGFLLPRSENEIQSVLSHAFGVFIEGRYLAGIGALLPYNEAGMGEIASLYTVTRFSKEGVGGHLVSHALKEASRAGFERVFACTTSQRVEQFFLRQGFRSVSVDEVPKEKWQGRSPSNRENVRCFARSSAETTK